MPSTDSGPTPLRQGTVDTFCAIYSVLNSLRIIHDLQILEGRDLFNATLLRLADQERLSDVLTQKADYGLLVDEMLDLLPRNRRMGVQRPFLQGPTPDARTFIDTCRSWLARPRRAAIVSFERYISPTAETPMIRHWTTISGVSDEGLILTDATPPPFDKNLLSFEEMLFDLSQRARGRLTHVLAPTLRLLFRT